MTAEISKSVLSGKINAISSKSDAHRLLICAALSDAPACIELNAFSDDIYATQDCLCALGAKIEKTHEERYRKLLQNIKDGKVFEKEGEIVWECRNCGHLHTGAKSPQVCPVCAHPQSFFEVRKTNY